MANSTTIMQHERQLATLRRPHDRPSLHDRPGPPGPNDQPGSGSGNGNGNRPRSVDHLSTGDRPGLGPRAPGRSQPLRRCYVAAQPKTGPAPVGRPQAISHRSVADRLKPNQKPVQSRHCGAPQVLSDALAEELTLLRADTAGVRSATVCRLLGREPRTFADWCVRNAHGFPRMNPE